LTLEYPLNKIIIPNYVTETGFLVKELIVSCQIFGQKLHTAPVILINHALTGNSNLIGASGWWNELIGDSKTIDTNKYTILAFNTIGNGYDGQLIENYQEYSTTDVAKLFIQGLEFLNIKKLYALIGGSIGGGIAWEMIALQPTIAEHFIPIATDYKASDWVIANCYIQEQILANSSQPIKDARIQAMLLYRTPESFEFKFERSKATNSNLYNVESWLQHHGNKLEQRFELAAYKMMNQLLKTIDITKNGASFEKIMKQVEAQIHLIAIDTDMFFQAKQTEKTFEILKQLDKKVTYGEIKSLHGHDAFLIEYEQLNQLLKGIF
jgi:homoserine O-acetyltransferase/O-succinyltransferase